MDTKDLVVLVADADCEQVVRSLLQRWKSLGIRRISASVRRHPRHDPGCRIGASQYLRPFLTSHKHALVIFDRDGCGDERRRAVIQDAVSADLAANGWQDRSAVIVIDPELEIWLWSDSPHVATALGWGANQPGLRRFLASRANWPEDLPKPPDPKRAAEVAIGGARVRRRPRRSAAWFGAIAEKVSVSHCRDEAFVEMRGTLRRWFPPD